MRRRALLLFASAALLGSSCLSPTLPLPPPDVPDSIYPGDDADHWVVSGHCEEGASVIVENETTGRIAGFADRDKTGRYSVVIEGKECDNANVKEQPKDSLQVSPPT